MNDITLQRIQINSSTDSFLVRQGNAVLGIVERIKGCRTTRNPWKAYSGHGESLRYLGAHYPKTWDHIGWVQAKIEALRQVREACVPAVVASVGPMFPQDSMALGCV